MQFEFLQKLEYEIKYDDIDFPRLFSGPTYYILLVIILELGSGRAALSSTQSATEWIMPRVP